MEVWKILPGYNGRYEVSDHGNIRRSADFMRRRRGGPTYAEMRVWLVKSGYRQVKISTDGRRFVGKFLGTLVLETFVGPRPTPRHDMCHYDGVRTNDVLPNLRWDTRRNNHLDKKKHGTFQEGERHGMAKLTEPQVIEIRRSAELGIHLAKRFGVSPTQISVIRRRKSWKHIR